jgi:hypothetical protein
MAKSRVERVKSFGASARKERPATGALAALAALA